MFECPVCGCNHFLVIVEVYHDEYYLYFNYDFLSLMAMDGFYVDDIRKLDEFYGNMCTECETIFS